MATLLIGDLVIAEEMKQGEMAEIRGGSIYVDGNYWGEGSLDTRPWPGGVPIVNLWPDGSRTPY